MKHTRLLFASHVVCWFFLALSQAIGQPQLPDNYEKMNLYELGKRCNTLVQQGLPLATQTDGFARWMAVNDWQSLELHDQYNLYKWVSPAAVDRRQFSVRWTGWLAVPETGAYTLRQVPVYVGADARLKVTIGNKLVLDSTSAAAGDGRFVSSPLQLTAGQPLAIQVEMAHRVSEINYFGKSAPMVVLTWRHGQLPEAIIPTTAYEPPNDFAAKGTRGLKGEYFADDQWGKLQQTRLDAALDFAWSLDPVVSLHEREANQVLQACKAKLLDGNFLSRAAAEGIDSVYNYNLRLLAANLTVTERVQLAQTLKSKPDVLAKMTPEGMGRLIQAIYMLPGKEHLDVLGAWALSRPQPRCEAGVFPGWGEGFYQKRNTDLYWLMARFLQGPYAADADALCDRYLERPDGTCNLAVAYVAAYASQINSNPEKFVQRLEARVNDPAVKGDRLATWLIARAYARGAIPGRFEPLAGYSDLESVWVVAETNEQKFWVLQEMVARLSSVNKGDAAKKLIEERRGEFGTPEQQQAMAQWITTADALAATYAKQAGEQKLASQSAYVNELEHRRQAAVAQGDEAAASRFGALLDAVQNAPAQ